MLQKIKSKIILLKKFFKFLRKHLFRNTKYCFLYLWRLLVQEKKINCQFYTTEEVLELINQGKSIIRIGDGEIGIINYYTSLCYQIWSKEIREEFLKLIKNYQNSSNYILAIPIFLNYSNQELDNLPSLEVSKKFCWLPLKNTYEILFNQKIKYIDAHAFYRFDECQKIISHILNQNKNLILIANADSIAEIKQNKILSQKIKLFIQVPNQNSFESRDKITEDIKNLCINHNLNKKNSIFIFKGGLVKTIIADLSKDYQIIDAGEGFSSYVRNQKFDNKI